MENNIENSNIYAVQNIGVSFDIGKLFMAVLRNFWVVVLVFMIGAVALVGYDKLFVAPTYESSTQVYILSKSTDEGLNYSDMSVSSSLAQDFAKIVKSRDVTEQVIKELNLDEDPLNITSDDLKKLITVTGEDDSRIITISVVGNDPDLVCNITSTLRDASIEHCKEVMNLDDVKVVEQAYVPDKASSAGASTYAIIGGVFGAFIAIGGIIIAELMNDTISTAEEVEKYLSLSVLGSIPISDQYTETSKRRKKKKGIKKSNR